MSGEIHLLPFQARASQQIANRYLKLASDAKRPMEHKGWAIPFYQALSALTGAGKTPILADAVSQIRMTMPLQPIVLWISKAKAVVEQTFANFEPGGKYSHLIDPFTVVYLSNLSSSAIADGTMSILALATVGSFNQKDKEHGTLSVHQVKQDAADDSLWSRLTARTANGGRRPLVVVYDEGHNLTDQQATLLLDLEPDVLLVAGATLKPIGLGKLGRLIERLRQHGWTDTLADDTREIVHTCLVTAVSSKAVVEAGLVKRQIVLGGYISIMESMLDDMLDAMMVSTEKAKSLKAGFDPKAIYVCRTNISQDDGSADTVTRPFAERRAPPILIWRYLVEQKGVDPQDIAVYCDLKVDRAAHPLPLDFKLFSGGDDDFSVFSAGNYKHVIFNLALQEGWDDPACSFAYIDKSMGSNVQVEQVIGRVLRQPGARHYPDAVLNTATFFIRMDGKQEFSEILKLVQEKLGAEIPEVTVAGYTDPKDRLRSILEPKKRLQVPAIHIDAMDSQEFLAVAMAGIHDYQLDTVNTVGKGDIQRAVQAVGDGSKAHVQTMEALHSNRVTARWIVRREMCSLFYHASEAIEWADKRFDARIEITSPSAAALRVDAENLVDAYLEGSCLVFEEDPPYTVGAISVNPAKLKRFRHALHKGYDLNSLEQQVAAAIDETGADWVRNPVNGGFGIPLLDKGDTRNFYPDFLVWKDGQVFAIDPKGGHILSKDARRKLLDIRDEKGRRKVIVRFISKGKWGEGFEKLDDTGFTVLMIAKGSSKVKVRHVPTMVDAVAAALKS